MLSASQLEYSFVDAVVYFRDHFGLGIEAEVAEDVSARENNLQESQMDFDYWSVAVDDDDLVERWH